MRVNLPGWDKPSNWKVDIIIPCIEKDFHLLHANVLSIRKYLMHPIGGIYLVAPRSERIQKFCEDFSCHYIDEISLVGFSHDRIQYFPNGVDRRGWLFQQYIKLSVDQIGSSPWALVLDADTIMVRRQSFEKKGLIRVQLSTEYHRPYFNILKQLVPTWKHYEKSFVCHHFFLDKRDLVTIRNRLAGTSGRTWYEQIESNLDTNEASGFADYEVLGTYYFNERPDEVFFENFHNRTIKTCTYFSSYWRMWLLKRLLRTVSMHGYAN